MFWSIFVTFLLLQVTELSTRRRRWVHQLELLSCGTGEVSFNESAYGPDYFQCATYGLGAVAMVTHTSNCQPGAFSYPFFRFLTLSYANPRRRAAAAQSTGEPEQV